MPKFRVLIADEFVGWRRYVYTKLQGYPEFRVVGEAADGLDAIQKSQELQPDLILLEVSLPEINGIEVSRRVCGILPATTILFVSTIDSPKVMREALRASPCTRGYILKSEAGSDLVPAMKAVTRSR